MPKIQFFPTLRGILLCTYHIEKYDLYTKYHINRSKLIILLNNQNAEVNMIDKLCNILECEVEDIMTHYPDDNVF